MSFQNLARGVVRKPAVLLVGAMFFIPMGCERREKVLDIEAPGVDIEVHKSDQDGTIEINRTEREP